MVFLQNFAIQLEYWEINSIYLSILIPKDSKNVDAFLIFYINGKRMFLHIELMESILTMVSFVKVSNFYSLHTESNYFNVI